MKKITTKNIYTTIAAFLLIIAAIVNIRCERQRQQQNFQYYLHINSKPYKKSLKVDSLFAERLDSIKLLVVHYQNELVTMITLYE